MAREPIITSRNWCSGSSLPSAKLTDVALHYAEAGEGDPVILVHGGFADFRIWGGLSDFLSKEFKVFSYSRRGYFPNQAMVGDKLTVSVHSADLSSMISRLSYTPVRIVAESYGACVATLLAIRNPNQVHSMVIDEPPMLSLLRGDEGDLRELNHFESEVLRIAIERYDSGLPEDGARAIIDYLEGFPAYDSLPEEVKAVIADNSNATFSDLKGGLETIPPSDLRGLGVPTLILKSELGPSLLKRVVDRYSTLVPGCETNVIKGTTHGSIVDSPAYRDAVLEFLSRD